MKRLVVAGLAMLSIAAICAAPVAAQDMSKVMADQAEKAKTGLAILVYEIVLETGNRAGSGQAICISDKGMFMTMAIDPRFSQEKLQNFKLVLPGMAGKAVDAKFVGVDVLTGMGFVQADGAEAAKVAWSPVKFLATAALAPGKSVFSVGLFGDAGNTPYVSSAAVSAVLRVPDELAFVTGGSLGVPGSPVFNSEGMAIGIVGRQLPTSFATLSTNQGSANLPVSSRLESFFFLPVDEFGGVLKHIPQGFTRLPWVGINRFEMVTAETAKLIGLDPNTPAIMVTDIIKDMPAAKAGLKDRDVIIAINGQKIEKFPTADLTVQAFVGKLMRTAIGTEVTFTLHREAGPADVKITLAEMPQLPSEAKMSFNGLVGLAVRNKVMLDRYLDPSSPTKDVEGLIVVGVGKGSAAEKTGLAVNDVVISIDGVAMKDVANFKQVVDDHIAKKRDADMTMVVQRATQPVQVSLRLPAPTSAPAK